MVKLNIVIPGEKITKLKENEIKYYTLVNCEIKETKKKDKGKEKEFEVLSKFYGVVEKNSKEKKIEVIPLNGRYMPKVGDFVIGIIKEVMPNMWIVDINSPFNATLLLKDAFNEKVDTEKIDISSFYDFGDTIFCKVINITRNKTVRVSLKNVPLKKLEGGFLLEISNLMNYWLYKKRDEILKVLNKNDLEFVIGKNRLIWLRGEKSKILDFVSLIKEIEKEKKFDIKLVKSLFN